jgi:hypothetical protein
VSAVRIIDGVFEPDAEHGGRFIAMPELDADDAEAVRARVRPRILRVYHQRRGMLDKDLRKEMGLRDHGGGLSLEATVRIAGIDRNGLERLPRYCAIRSCPPKSCAQCLVLASNL